MLKTLKVFFTEDNITGTKPAIPLELFIQILLLLLGLWGCMAIYVSTSFSPAPFYFAGRQLLWLTIGLMIMFFSSRIPFDFYLDQAWRLAIIAYIPLIAVLFLGVEINGMRGWFAVGNSMIQPSEFGKVIYILLLCSIAIKYQGVKCFGYMLLVALIWMLPIALQPDFGTVLVYAAGFLIVYCLIGGQLRYIIGLPFIALPFVIYFCRRNPYLIKRFSGFINPDSDPLGSGWHIRQFQFTMARGGLWGTGSEHAYWTNSYLPLSHSDSVFAGISESLGFVGAAPLLIIMLVLLFMVYIIAIKVNNDKSRKLFIMTTGLLFAFQFMLHVSVNVTMLPPTGVTLPILSYGGSSMLATMLAFGLLLSAASEREKINFEF
jgi:cell division protein FtsW